MSNPKFTDGQIVGVLGQGEAGYWWLSSLTIMVSEALLNSNKCGLELHA